jgi:hypothetical protein
MGVDTSRASGPDSRQSAWAHQHEMRPKISATPSKGEQHGREATRAVADRAPRDGEDQQSSRPVIAKVAICANRASPRASELGHGTCSPAYKFAASA